MAKLTNPATYTNVFQARTGNALPVAGTFLATIEDICDQYKVLRTKFNSTETEERDEATFLLSYLDDKGHLNLIASPPMRISGHEKSNLVATLTGILGHAPAYNWDYLTLKGTQCLLTVQHKPRRDGKGVYASIASISPLPAGFKQALPQAPSVQINSTVATAAEPPTTAAVVLPTPSPAPVDISNLNF